MATGQGSLRRAEGSEVIRHIYYYLDKYNGGKTTDEKDIRLCGVIDSEYRFVEKWRLMK